MAAAQDGPIDIGAEVFALHRAARGAFDGGAAFGGDLSVPRTPLTYECRRYTNFRRKLSGLPCLQVLI
jgi:hypothetical protein